ncbi:putative odorant receptor 92a [Manduca sexta]|uniref:Odorant receptor n=1 Tax=Manduca sexta TaxID=7130 RepID=A0A921Z5Q0_MANSE|nr:putative odorant receptor 92a [Manduca sexta]KAG6451286.1 hypothetical protein O3G_MSEX007051 [Manduca sexta]
MTYKNRQHQELEMELSHLPGDYLKPLIACFDLLARCNIGFFHGNSSYFKKYWRYSYIISCVVAYYSSLTVYALKIFLGQMELFELAYVVPVFVVCTQAILKAIIVIIHKGEIRALVLQLGETWRTDNLTTRQLNKKNLLLKKLNFCYGVFRIVYSYLGTEFLLISLCSHLSTEFCLLREDLLNVKPVGNGRFGILPDSSNIELHDIVVKHQKLIKFSEQLNEIFNKMIFVNLSSVTITVCFFAFATKVARGPVDMANNFMAVMALILPIFNLCYYAEMLINASAGMAESAYHSLWYVANKQYQMSIWFIIRRSQKPCCLTSLKFSPVALHTFTAVLSTTWSYFSLASSLFENEN